MRPHAIVENTDGRSRRVWVWSVLGGLFSVVFGFVLLSYELVGLFALVYFACAYFLASGIFQLSLVYRTKSFRWWYPIMGGLSIIAGIVGLAWPGITLFAIAILIGWVLLGWGLSDIMNVFSNRHLGHWWVFLVRGLFALVVGVIALQDPGSAVLALVLVVGIWSIIFGVTEIAVALEAHHALRTDESR